MLVFKDGNTTLELEPIKIDAITDQGENQKDGTLTVRLRQRYTLTVTPEKTIGNDMSDSIFNKEDYGEAHPDNNLGTGFRREGKRDSTAPRGQGDLQTGPCPCKGDVRVSSLTL